MCSHSVVVFVCAVLFYVLKTSSWNVWLIINEICRMKIAVALWLCFSIHFIFSASQELGIAEGTLRLVRPGEDSSTKTRSGIVQVYVGEIWGNICGLGITRSAADTICRQLGFFAAASGGSAVTTVANTMFNLDNSPTIIGSITCPSNAITAGQCMYTLDISAQCMDDNNDLAVRCNSDDTSAFDTPSLGNVRLRDGRFSNEGVLEVYCAAGWGSVCLEAVKEDSMRLACAQLGYNSVFEFLNNPFDLLSDNVPIWYDGTSPFTECSLEFQMDTDYCLTSCNMCPSTKLPGNSECSHDLDVYLICGHNDELSPVMSDVETIEACVLLNDENTTAPNEGTGGTDGTGGTGTGGTERSTSTTQTPPPSIPTSDSNSSPLTTGVIGAIIGVVGFIMVLVIVIVAIFAYWTVRSRSKNQRMMESQPHHMVKISASSSEDKLSTTRPNDYIKPPFMEMKDISHDKLSELLLPSMIEPENLKLLEKIGQGEFGIVYRGLLTTYEGGEASVSSVAVKTLKGSYSKTQTDELIQEAETMIQFQHLNVLTLTGVCVGLLDSPCIVMPFMSNGSLLSYVRKEAADLTVSDSSDESLRLDTTKHILSMCLQVAKGMAYLTEHKFIHRDLAARNCMISADGVIKVADFGLAEDVYTKEYFKQDRSSEESVKLPLKWMALESIHYGKFSEKSDVWSFGVLCWEVFSVGKSPYPGLSPSEVVKMLDSGGRLARPSNAACCDKSYALILSCWEQAPDKRPHFFELVQSIEQLLGPLADYVDFTSNFARKFSG